MPEQLEHFHVQTEELEELAFNGMPIIHNALEDVLMSVVVQAWSAFEVLLKQLLEKSIEKHPQCFPHLMGSEPRRFMKRDLFRATYEAYFPDATKVDNLLRDESVDALCVLRNLVAHNSGYVDKTFHDDSEAMFSVAWAALKIGERFEFKGTLSGIWLIEMSSPRTVYKMLSTIG